MDTIYNFLSHPVTIRPLARLLRYKFQNGIQFAESCLSLPQALRIKSLCKQLVPQQLLVSYTNSRDRRLHIRHNARNSWRRWKARRMNNCRVLSMK